MNKLILFVLGVAACISLGEACGFGTLCFPSLPSLPTCPPPAPLITCPSAPLLNSCGSGGFGGCGGVGGCARCRTRKRQFRKRVTRDTVHHIVEFVDSTDDHPVCNNVHLHDIIQENLSHDAEKTKDAIHEAVGKKMHGLNFAVICSAHPFFFTADNHMYCLHGNSTMTCYVFQSN